MRFDYKSLNDLMNEYGNAFYLLDSAQFELNFIELKNAFSKIYPHFNIAYSYKTNYTPKLCKTVNRLGGLAEVVSDMELEIALRIGVDPKHIIWNGPHKNSLAVERLLLSGGIVNIDSECELENIERIARQNTDKKLRVGIRCNFPVGDGVISRFGFDTQSEAFEFALKIIRQHKNIRLASLQCHFATRALKTWKPRAVGMLEVVDRVGVIPEYIDLGGGLFGKMDDSLKRQFDSEIPSYEEYAREVAPVVAEKFEHSAVKPILLIEPGSALVGDCMYFASRLTNIKTVQNKSIGTLLGSIYNINPTLNKKNPPICVYSDKADRKEYFDVDFGGFTCIESDYLYRHFNGRLAVGDIVVFGNVGSYSVVLKPPFILPNFPMLDICGDKTEVVKRGENFDDLFHTFAF